MNLVVGKRAGKRLMVSSSCRMVIALIGIESGIDLTPDTFWEVVAEFSIGGFNGEDGCFQGIS
jgi:hypothetical protein